MRNVLAIAQKELKSYFSSPIAYIVIGLFALFYGYFYAVCLQVFLRDSMSMPLVPGRHVTYGHAIAEARAAAGDQAFERAWAQGAAMALEQVFDHALEALNARAQAAFFAVFFVCGFFPSWRQSVSRISMS